MRTQRFTNRLNEMNADFGFTNIRIILTIAVFFGLYALVRVAVPERSVEEESTVVEIPMVEVYSDTLGKDITIPADAVAEYECGGLTYLRPANEFFSCEENPTVDPLAAAE